MVGVRSEDTSRRNSEGVTLRGGNAFVKLLFNKVEESAGRWICENMWAIECERPFMNRGSKYRRRGSVACLVAQTFECG